MRSLAEVVKPETFKDTTDSEYLDTLLVAVPKNLAKEWNTSYERLTSMVVPRSSAFVRFRPETTLTAAKCGVDRRRIYAFLCRRVPQSQGGLRPKVSRKQVRPAAFPLFLV